MARYGRDPLKRNETSRGRLCQGKCPLGRDTPGNEMALELRPINRWYPHGHRLSVVRPHHDVVARDLTRGTSEAVIERKKHKLAGMVSEELQGEVVPHHQ